MRFRDDAKVTLTLRRPSSTIGQRRILGCNMSGDANWLSLSLLGMRRLVAIIGVLVLGSFSVLVIENCESPRSTSSKPPEAKKTSEAICDLMLTQCATPCLGLECVVDLGRGVCPPTGMTKMPFTLHDTICFDPNKPAVDACSDDCGGKAAKMVPDLHGCVSTLQPNSIKSQSPKCDPPNEQGSSASVLAKRNIPQVGNDLVITVARHIQVSMSSVTVNHPITTEITSGQIVLSNQ